MAVAPSAARAATAERAVAARAEHEDVPRRAERAVAPPSCRARVIPSTSVLSRRPPARDRRTRVLAAPTSRASGDASAATANAASFSGIVSDSPAHSGPSPATKPASSASRTSMRRRSVQSSRPRAA